MSVLPIAALLGSLASLLARRRARVGALTLDDLALVGALHLALIGVLATVLAWAGWFSATSVTLMGAALALAAWPRKLERVSGPASTPASGRLHGWILVGLVVAGVLLRLPSIPAPLAGRDQGTYVLRAALSARTGGLGFTDEVLAQAGRERAEDLLGLYPKSDEPWRADRYEAAYRPGTYLASRDRGEVVVQFFHVHPMLLACERVAFGEVGGTGGVALPWQAGLWLLVMACVARRLWPRGPWAALALGLIASSPLAIWTGRTPLSETTMALFEWSAVLVGLRMRARDDDPLAPWWIAGLLAATAWVRGNALLVLPVVLAVAWLRPRSNEGEPRALALLLAGSLASVVVHALTVFPYLHDELLRRVPDLQLGPWALIGVAASGVVVWIGIDRALGQPRLASLRARVLGWLPRVWASATLLAFAAWWTWRVEAGERLEPFSRLDPVLPLLGPPVLLAAALGLLVVGWRWRVEGRADAWLLAIAVGLPITAMLYAPRNLPGLGLFYYGRYLVPELLPCAMLAAVAASAWLVERVAGRSGGRLRRLASRALGLLAIAGLAWSVAGPLITAPHVRLRENEAAAPAIAWLAERVPPGAIVIAGGEGWHHGHTYNQVGGALALGEGVRVLPYRTREDAWSTAWELLIAGPRRRGEPAPKVFLLVNEAAHHRRRADGRRVALLDDMIWAPFVVERIDLLELFVHALTPVSDVMPSRVARHELRMGLLELAVDEQALARLERIVPAGDRCLDPERALVVEVPGEGSPEVAHLVLVAEPGTAAVNSSWRVEVDGEPLVLEPIAGLRPHPRATLGPYPLAARPRRIAVFGASERAGEGRCPHGELAELRLLPRERSALLEEPSIAARTFEPMAVIVGKPLDPVTWVGGRSLTRHRPGIQGSDEVVGEALVLESGATLEFPWVDLPLDRAGRPLPLDVIVSLAASEAREGARLHVRIGGGETFELASIVLPEPRGNVWPAPAQDWTPKFGRARVSLELDADAGGRVLIRDVALFVRGPGIESR
ncbi:hypothetical protein ACNOYE_04280 [Nannocystaceae bacterium ST9]